MRICRAKDYYHACRVAANIISAQIIIKPDCVLGLATGATPVGLYEQLIRWYEKGDLDFHDVRSINLDEYKGLSPAHPQSYRYYMDKHLFDHINIQKQNTHVPDGMETDTEKACAVYDRIIKESGGIDLQLLGLGMNGHIGFNEPGTAFEKETHCVTLAESTIKANSGFFGGEDKMPGEAYTMGIKSIMQARKILMMVSGESKAEIVRQAFCGPITPQVPASVLQLHNDVTLVGDEAALSLLV